MKKQFQRVFAAFLAAATASVSIAGISANAMIGYTSIIPETAVDITDVCECPKGQYLDESSYMSYYNNDSHTVAYLSDFKFNYTTLYVTNNAEFIKFYNEYNADQVFEKYDEEVVLETFSQYGERLKVMLYDKTDKNGNHSTDFSNYTNKRDEALKFCRILQEKGYIAHATYTSFSATSMKGGYDNSVLLENAVSGKSEEIRKTAEAFDSSIEVTEQSSENSNVSTYKISSVENIEDGVAIARELKDKFCKTRNDNEVYPSSVIVTGVQESAFSSSFQGSETDLTTAHYTGDIDNNETVDTSDIFDVMYYVARKGAGVENVSFTDGNAVEEAAVFAAADIDGNGKLDSTDVYYMMKYCAEKGAGLNPSWGD